MHAALADPLDSKHVQDFRLLGPIGAAARAIAGIALIAGATGRVRSDATRTWTLQRGACDTERDPWPRERSGCIAFAPLDSFEAARVSRHQTPDL
jgi:hypothetical protein